MEVEAKAVTRNDDKRQQKIWIAVLTCLAVLIVGLVIAIIVVAVNRGREVTNNSVSNEVSEVTDDQSFDTYERVSEGIRRAIGNSPTASEEQILATYETYIASVSDEKAKAMLELDYIDLQIGYDSDKTERDKLVGELLEKDKILESVDSAVRIMNAAYYYGMDELYGQYEGILLEREKAMGIDVNMNTEG